MMIFQLRVQILSFVSNKVHFQIYYVHFYDPQERLCEFKSMIILCQDIL